MDKTNFAIYESFNDKSVADEVITAVEDNSSGSLSYNFGEIQLFEKPFTDHFRICVAYRGEDIPDELDETLPKIASNLMKGDKVTIQQVLGANSLFDLSYVR